MPDFSLNAYEKLLKTFIDCGYSFQTLEGFVSSPKNKTIVLRHDVDRLPGNSLKIACLERKLGVVGSYYYRIIPKCFDGDIIKEVVDLGHEIGYHYEDLALENGNADKAFESFCKNLEHLRKCYPVKTICMHGSPMSKWDSRLIWRKYDYKKLGIVAEPYFDIDYSRVLYITDTGRKWNASNISIRDKVEGEGNLQHRYNFHSSFEIIRHCGENKLPGNIMMNIHPHRWFNFGMGWAKELVMQNIKNIIKYIIVKKQES